MRFNVATILCALMATTQVVASPAPSPTPPGPLLPAPATQNNPAQGGLSQKAKESLYEIGAITCLLGGTICDATGRPYTKEIAIAMRSTAYCCLYAIALPAAKRQPEFQVAAKKLGAKAAVVGSKFNAATSQLTANGGALVANCYGTSCQIVKAGVAKVTGNGPQPPQPGGNVKRSNKGDDEEDETLFERAEPEPEVVYKDDAELLSEFVGGEAAN